MANSLLNANPDATLLIDHSEITFANKRAGKEAIASLLIRQLGANTPVLISVANPNWFTLSQSTIDSSFAPSLCFIPANEGSLIYIRYAPKSVTRHRTFLMVTTPYDVQTVVLEGAPAGLASWFRLPKWLTLKRSFFKSLKSQTSEGRPECG